MTDHPHRPTLQEAFCYATPLAAMGRTRLTALGTAENPGNYTLNQWHHRRALRHANVRNVTTPNADTLYSGLWLDLSAGPALLSLPDMGGRYYSLGFLDVATNHFAVVGRRTAGGRARRIAVVGPGHTDALPPDAQIVRAPGRDALVVLRILVDGEADLPAVAALQDRCAVRLPAAAQGLSAWSESPASGDGPEAFIDRVNVLLARNPPPSHEQALLNSFAAFGIGPVFRWRDLTPHLRDQWQREWPALNASLGGGGLFDGEWVSNGWHTSRRCTGDFGTHYRYRAQIAVDALLALPPAEALYIAVRVDHEGAPLSGASRYRLELPADLPVDGFWSLSMYQAEPDGRLFFVDNAIGRHAIGDRTPGLRRSADGRIPLCIQHEAPRDPEQLANWLPAPEGPFSLVLRAYEPRAELRDGTHTLPALHRLP